MTTPSSQAADSIEPTSSASLVGKLVSNRYLVQQVLGEGGMGAVYLAEHTHMRKRVALKLLHPEMSKDKEVLERFKREAEAAAHIDHPNVVSATDFGQTEDGSFFLVLEYVEGQNLRSAMAGGPMPPQRALHVARQIALALDRAHGSGIVHRDLKPENIMLVRKGDDPDFVKVLDFGIAKIEEREARAGSSQPLTRLGTILGTPEYMAPEQAVGEPVGPPADLYAVGVMLYEMLTAKHPFHAEERMAVLSMHIVAPVPFMAERSPGIEVPRPVEDLVRTLLEKDKNARPAGARALVDAIDAAAGQSAISLPQHISSRSFARESSSDLSRSPAPSRTSQSDVVANSTRNVDSAWRSGDALAKTDYGVPVSSNDIRTQPASPVARLVEELIAKAKRLPKPWLFAACGVVPLMVLVLLLTVAFSSARRAEDAPDGASPSFLPAPLRARSTHASAERLSAAAAQGVPALQALAREFPGDPAVKKQLVTALIDAARSADALLAIDELARLDQGVIDDAIVQFVAGAASRLETADAAFKLLEGPLGERGVDALYDLSTSKTANVLAKNRAAKALAQDDVRANASVATRVMLDVKSANACSARRDWLQRAKQGGDGRALPTLKAMRNTRGCGFMGLKDCWPCIKKDDVEEAISAVEGRSGETRGAR